jgi:formylglycine-generating enzyme required for sulfatase activity
VYSIERGYIENGSNRIIRGGSWNNNANNLQVGNVNNTNPDNRNNNLGFRPSSTGAFMSIPAFTDAGTE